MDVRAAQMSVPNIARLGVDCYEGRPHSSIGNKTPIALIGGSAAHGGADIVALALEANTRDTPPRRMKRESSFVFLLMLTWNLPLR
jgi:hypothetical protein